MTSSSGPDISPDFTERQSADFGPQRLAYSAQAGNANQTTPGVIFCGGFRSDMGGTKALALAAWATARQQSFVRFDYFGHGSSTGAFTDGTISHWRGDIPHILDTLTQGPQILVGSSFGGWLSTLAALDRPDRIAGLVLIAPAIDMTERLMWDRFSDRARAKLESEGLIYDPSEYDPEGYPITHNLILDGRNHLLLGDTIDISVPVRIIHGQQDTAVPWQLSLELAESLATDDVEVQLLKGGDHRLSEPRQIDALLRLIEELLDKNT
jgi:pimeloyl-ACP methyl ester carboxylesterase